MKFDRVTLENIGIHTRKVFHFGTAPLVLIYGANEAGKTTALNGLRQALFGFKLRTPYLTGRQMSADVKALMASGDRLEFSRRKGRPDEVTGTLAGRNLQNDEVSGLLGKLDLGSYERLFGFSLDELREGETALKDARLSEALAGGGLGGMSSLQRLRSDLHESLADLYRSRGTNSKIKLKLEEIRKCSEALRAAQVLPAEVEELQQQLTDLQQHTADVRAEYARMLETKLAAEQVREALPKYRQYCALTRQLKSIDIPAGIDLAFVNQWGDYADQRKKLIGQLEQERLTLESEEQRLEALDGSQEISESEADIEQLGHQAGEIASARSAERPGRAGG
ncbi:MAG: AAA family ATPase [Pirellulaceae bacterium]